MNETHNPDVLSCLANLSNDEVFTPPSVVNQMLDMLPEELFQSSKTTFLDIGCKSGVFLREITKRLITGLADEMPDLQARVDHILHKQVFGIATTELTSLVSRRTLYCSKYPNCRYSASPFETVEGNIRFRNIPHTFVNGRCKWCGASEDQFGDAKRKGLETHAYEFIHTDHPEEIFKMKFDVIVGNPPYQLEVNEAGKGLGAIPLYQKFVLQAFKLMPRYVTMIIPSRWFAGGVGLDEFRMEMLNDRRIKRIVDYIDSNDCFPGVDVNGGICYFLWDKSHSGLCRYTNINAGVESTTDRRLNEYNIFIRRNEALSIIHKVLSAKERMLSEKGGCSPQTPYGFLSSFSGNAKRKSKLDCEILSSKGWMFVERKKVLKSIETIDMYKPMISKLSCEHAGNPDKNGQYRVLSRMEILNPGQICTQSYLVVSPSISKKEAENLYGYLRTKFVRFLILQTLVGMNISISNFQFVPWCDFSKPWTDAELYAKYKLTKDEIAFIESMIKPME